MNKPEVREINKLQMKENWKDPNFLKKMRETRNIEPTLPEKKLIKILLELKSNFEYTGDYKISIDGRVPDFTDLVNKKVIEVFSEYYHGEEFRKEKYNDSKSNKDHEKEKIDHYKLNGYECLVLWESELKNEEYSKEKIKKFLDDKEN